MANKAKKMGAVQMISYCETTDDWIAMICNQVKIRRPSKSSYWYNVLEAVFTSLKGIERKANENC